MMASPDPAGDAARDRLVVFLDQAEAEGCDITFWWRDDDTEDATPALNRLLELAARHDLPLALAVVPKRATEALAERLQREPRVSVLQHGWRHRNYAPEGEKKVELGDHRPTDTILDELSRGFDRLRIRFPEKFLPVLVPPWNRVADSVRDQRRLAGLIGLSTFGPVPSHAPHWVNIHVDILEWKPPRPRGRAETYGQICEEVERRLAGNREPIGIMTHHLVQEEPSWDFLGDLLAILAPHKAAIWPPVAKVFGLPQLR